MPHIEKQDAPARLWNGLIMRAADGDQSAMADLYGASGAMVLGLALRILGDRSAAEDVVAEVYAQAWQDAASFDSERGEAVAWLMTITRSRAIDSLRSRRREPAGETIEAASGVAFEGPGPEETSSEAERRKLVRAALAGLRAEQREAIQLAYFCGLTQAEIASQLGQPLGTIKTRIRLGMIALRDLLRHVEFPLSGTGHGGV
jgi:RNA polymerase sigma-70 factor (ECF subfamily)